MGNAVAGDMAGSAQVPGRRMVSSAYGGPARSTAGIRRPRGTNRGGFKRRDGCSWRCWDACDEQFRTPVALVVSGVPGIHLVRHMRIETMLQLVALLLVLATVVTSAQSTAPYLGLWKYDSGRSDLGTQQATITESGGEFTVTDGSKAPYKFRVDGKPYVDSSGASVVWTSKGPRVWQAAYSEKGKNVAVETYTLSADGKTLTMRATVEGMPGVQEMVNTRSGAGDGLAGTWTGKLQMPPFDLEIQASGNDGLIYRAPGMFEVKAAFDGKPYPVTGPAVTKEATASFTRVGPRSFRTVQKQGETPMQDATIAVSEDGKTLTLTGIGPGGTKATWVFSRAK